MSVAKAINSACQYILKQITSFNKSKPITAKICGLIGFSTVFLISRKLTYVTYRKYKKYPPGPVGLPFFGSFFSLMDQNKFNMYLGENYGPICQFQLGPKINQIVFNDLDLIQKHLKNNEFNHRPHSMTRKISPFVEPPLSQTNGKQWSYRRKLFYSSLLKVTDSKYITKYVQNNISNKIIIPSIENAINNNNGLWWPRKPIFNFTFNTIFGASFGKNLTMSIDNKRYKKFQLLIDKVFDYVIPMVVIPLFSQIIGDLFVKYMGLVQYITDAADIINQWIEEYIKNSDNINNINNINNKTTYIDMMLNNSNIDKKTAASDILMSFSVGTVTTADSIELMLLNAAKYPDIQNKIYMELRELFNNTDNITIDSMLQLNNAHYLRAFIEESWRKQTSISLPRELHKDYRIDFIDKNGNNDYYILPKGSGITFNNKYISRNKNKYGWKGNANEFNINNYLDVNNKYIKSSDSKFDKNDIKCKYSVFGYGGRQCPGMSLARKEVMFAISILLYKYKFSGPNGENDTNFTVPNLLEGLGTTPIPVIVKRRL